MIAWLRAAAAAIALAAFVDPALHVARPARVPVDLVVGRDASVQGDQADALAERVRRELGSIAAFDSGERPGAAILLGPPPPDAHIAGGVPVAAVDLADSMPPNVRIARVSSPASVLPGEEAAVAVELAASGVAGKSSVVALEQAGVTLAKIEHRWTGDDERFRAELRYAPPAPGVNRLRVVARPLGGETSDRDNVADLGIAVAARTLRVLVHEPRPSWAATFVRRALEADPVFEVAALAAPSRGPVVSAGAPPVKLSAEELETFDAIVVGAPDALAGPEVAALEAFARVRGGGVILLPDRRPSGSYLSLLPHTTFEEILLDRPTALQARRGAGLYAAELAAAVEMGRGGEALATLQQGGTRRAVVGSWPRGAGRVVVSGALDAWRYRARDEDGFVRFWSSVVAGVAAAAPPRIGVRLDPSVAAPGDPVTVRVALRATELEHDGHRTLTPPVDARVISGDGSDRAIRLWPTSEPGVFQGRFDAPGPGRYDVRASLAPRAAADAGLLVADGVVAAGDDPGAVLRWTAAATGGVTVAPSEIDRLATWLRTIPKPAPVMAVRPMRSPWWMIPFAGCLSAAWALGRTRGLR